MSDSQPWHSCVVVCSYSRGTSNKKCRNPILTKSLKDVLSSTVTTSSGEDIGSVVEGLLEGGPAAALAALPKTLCKKDAETGVQKQLKCVACNTQMEALDALKAHLGGQKHQKNFLSFIEYKSKQKVGTRYYEMSYLHFYSNLLRVRRRSTYYSRTLIHPN